MKAIHNIVRCIINSGSTVQGRLAINTLPAIESHNLVTLGFKVGMAGTYVIQFKGADSFDASTPVYLEDTRENIFINLRENQSYTFDYDPSDEADRFKVHFAEPADSNEEGISIYSAGNSIYILNPENTGSTVEVYNVMGQRIKTLSLNSNSTEININEPGNYIVRIITGSQVVCTKVFVH